LLNENGDALNNLSLTLPSSEITLIDSEISQKAAFETTKSASYGDIISPTGEKEKVPFIFEKIERGDWIMKPGMPESGEITQIKLKGATGEYIIADKGSTPLESGGVRLGFDTSGNVTSEMIVDEAGNPIETPESIVFVYADGSTQETTWETENFKQTASASDIRITQDGGRTPGILTGVEFSSDGYLLGNYSNQNQIELAFIPLSRFRSTEALASTSSNPLLYEIKYDDQDTVGQNFYGFFKPGQGMTGSLVPYALESSNVDISKEMVNLIKYQRAIQLNARTVQTADQILQQAIQLKG
jgi:flagellar hook-basal body protein